MWVVVARAWNAWWWYIAESEGTRVSRGGEFQNQSSLSSYSNKRNCKIVSFNYNLYELNGRQLSFINFITNWIRWMIMLRLHTSHSHRTIITIINNNMFILIIVLWFFRVQTHGLQTDASVAMITSNSNLGNIHNVLEALMASPEKINVND